MFKVPINAVIINVLIYNSKKYANANCSRG
nr:MAG TPA: hypothetical protein [Caudoviricetes sp.]